MLTYTSTEQLRDESLTLQYLHLTLLGALRDRAVQLEFRFGDDWVLVYQRVEGRDWELMPPPEDVAPELKTVIRSLSRLVKPERPETLFTAPTIGGRMEAPEAGWLSYQFADRWLDILVQIDPLEPGGFIRMEWGDPDLFTDDAARILNDFFDFDPESHDSPG